MHKKEYHTNRKTKTPFFIKCNQVSACMKPTNINEAYKVNINKLSFLVITEWSPDAHTVLLNGINNRVDFSSVSYSEVWRVLETGLYKLSENIGRAQWTHSENMTSDLYTAVLRRDQNCSSAPTSGDLCFLHTPAGMTQSSPAANAPESKRNETMSVAAVVYMCLQGFNF